ncbi:carnitine O-acetyltransferase-like [Coccinella septempunctata]|uniref:carnitine O-acetyltransferase-like n=1 Tax=Coccinella septempunctata TaxID=41139 RepID=UPI001D060D55|nr:carnitine O-acetyltransferase-like [Coccinella septempunctata]
MYLSKIQKIVNDGLVKITRIARNYSNGDCVGVRRCNPPLINPQNLPYLPIPKLENTLHKFIKSCEPFVSYKVIVETKEICEMFQKKEGKYLQKYLISKAQNSYNWLDDWYTQCAYLCNRDSLPMSTSPIMTFPPQKFRKTYQQREYVAKLILAILKFRKLCYCNKLPVETWHKYPLDMGVYKKLFANIRLPKPVCDQLYHYPNSQHIIIMYKNNLFKVKVMNNCGDPLSFRQLTERIDEVMTRGKATGIPFGLLTSLNRDTWAGVYEHMKDIGNNEELLEHIEKSMFLINIDNPPPCPVCDDEDRKLNSCQNGFHGYGPKVNGANRWYGKTLQFFSTRDGCSGIIFEHSPVEAIPLGKMADYILNYIAGDEWREVPDIILRERPLKMDFIPSEDIINAMNDASEHLEQKMNNFRIDILHYDRFGKEFIKENKLSPDAIIQAALQFANLRLHNSVTPQHETASTRRFYMGRTDTIRSCTREVVRFLQNMSRVTTPTKEKFELLQDAVKRHQQITADVMMGRGIDRHLFGLLMASRELKIPLPKLLRCEAYHKSGRFRIVTRQNPTKRNCFTCYSPGLDGGYGCCYNPRSEDINMCVTCKRSDPECHPGKFLDAWACSMRNIADLILRYKLYQKECFSRGKCSKC